MRSGLFMFNANSGLVKLWFGAVMTGTYKYSDVPNLSNLREQVKVKVEEMGYDTENENAA